MDSRNVQILFPVNIPTAFDYALPMGMEVCVGDFVYAPIGKQIKLGVVWRVGSDTQGARGRSLKEIIEVKPTRPLPSKMIEFVNWVARYNCVSPGLVLRMVVRSYKALEPSAEITLYDLSGQRPAKMTSARARVLELGQEQGGPFPAPY